MQTHLLLRISSLLYVVVRPVCHLENFYCVLSYLGVVYLSYRLYFKTSCVYCCLVVLYILSSSYGYLLYCVCIAVFTLDAGLPTRSQYSEGPATGHLDTGFSLVSLCLKANAEMVPKIPSCHYMLLM